MLPTSQPIAVSGSTLSTKLLGARSSRLPSPSPSLSPSIASSEAASLSSASSSTRLCRRRTARRDGRSSATGAVRAPPALVRQCDRKVSFVDSLVDSATQIVLVIWPLANVACRSAGSPTGRGVLPLKTFIQETLRRSRTSYSTLQVALYYLICIKDRVPALDFEERTDDRPGARALHCGRRMFLAGLILASKYLQDRNYSARAWSKISGLTPAEINANEMAFLEAIRWRLHVTEAAFQRWTELMLRYTSVPPPPSYPCAVSAALARSGIPFPASVAAAFPTPPSSNSPSPSSSPTSSGSIEARPVNWTAAVLDNLTADLVRDW